MEAERTIQFLLDTHPKIFFTRKHCLNFLFCVCGNGYEWINGELSLKVRDQKVTDWENAHPNKIHHAVENPDAISEYQTLIAKEDDLYVGSVPLDRWIRLSKKYSKLYTAPENITDDWKAVLEECKQLLINDGVKL